MTVKEIFSLAMSGYVPEKRISSSDSGMFGANNPNSKIVLQYNSKGEFMAKYYSVSEAERETGIAAATISKCLHEKAPWAGRQHFVFRFAKSTNSL